MWHAKQNSHIMEGVRLSVIVTTGRAHHVAQLEALVMGHLPATLAGIGASAAVSTSRLCAGANQPLLTLFILRPCLYSSFYLRIC